MIRWLRVKIKRMLPRGLFGRSLIIIVAPMVLLQAVVVYVFFERQFEDVTRRLAQGVAGEVSMLVDAYRTFPENEAKLAEIARSTMGIQVAFTAGEALPYVKPRPFYDIVGLILTREIEAAIGLPVRIDTTEVEDMLEVRVAVEGGVLRILAPRKRLLSGKWHFLLVYMVSASIVLTALAIMFLRNQIRPIRALALAAEEFGKGRDVPDFRPAGASEVRRASSAFLKMQGRIRRQVDQRTTMLAGVSHDLRTPLTRLRLALSMMEDTEDAREMKADLTEMEKMLEEYLAFARGDQQSEPTVEKDVGTVVKALVENVRRGGSDVWLTTEVGDGGDLMAQIKPVTIGRAVNNLLDNATTHGTRAHVHIAALHNRIEISVEDNGPGIPKEARADAFRPFNRLDPARNANRSGVGLGLTIALDAARAHGGGITLGDSDLGGLRATIAIPM